MTFNGFYQQNTVYILSIHKNNDSKPFEVLIKIGS